MDPRSAAYYDHIAAHLYTAVIADIMDDLGYPDQVMRFDIRPLYPEARVVGRAATMLASEVYDMPAEPYKLVMSLLDSLSPGAVIVCTAQGSRRAAMWGELLSCHVQAQGGRGAVIDGLARDQWGIVEARFPVFASGLTPADSKGRCDVIAIRVPIAVGGVLVRDGDLIFGDYDGCLAVPQAIEAEVIGRALEKVAGENEVREILRRGGSIQQVFKDYGIL